MVGEKEEILQVIELLYKNKKLDEIYLEEGIVKYPIFLEKKDFDEIDNNQIDLKMAIKISQSSIDFINKLELNLDIKISIMSEKNIKSYFDLITLIELESKISIIEYSNNSLYIGEIEKILIKIPQKHLRKKLIKILQNLTGGNLGSVSTGVILSNNTTSNLFLVDHIESKVYLHDLKRLEKYGVTIYYQLKYGSEIYVEMGYKIQNDVILREFLSSQESLFLKSHNKPLEEIENFTTDKLLSLYDLIDLEVKSEYPIRSSMVDAESMEKIKIDVALTPKRSIYNNKQENLEEKINNYKRNLEILEEIRDLEEKRKNADQIVIINYNNKKEVGRILSLFPTDMIDDVRISVFETGISQGNSGRYYALYLKGFKVHKNSNIVQLYNCEENFSHFKMKVFVEEDRYIYPFFAINKLEEMNEKNEIEEEAYYKMMLADQSLDQDTLKEMKTTETIAIFDNSKRIFKKTNLVFFKSSDFKKNVINVYNENSIREYSIFQEIKKTNDINFEKTKNILNASEKKLEESLNASIDILDEGYSELKKNWNELIKDLDGYKSKIIQTKNDKVPKLKAMLEEIVNIDDLEEIKDVFKTHYSKIIMEGQALLNLEENQIKNEKEYYERWRSNWKNLEDSNKNLEKSYLEFNLKMEDSKNKLDLELKNDIEESNRLLKELESKIEETDNKLKEILTKYGAK